MRNSLSLLTGQPNKIFASRGTLASRYKAGGVIPRYILDARTPRYFSEAIRQDELTDIVTHTRASTATYVGSNGVLQTAGVNVPRVGHHVWNGSAWVNEGLLHESEARTNYIRNSVAGGAVVGNPGSLPTHWAVFGGTAATELVAIGTENGVDYVDVRITGSPTSNGIFNFENTTQIAASEGQNWTLSFSARIVAGDTTNVTFLQPSINWRDGSGFVSRITGTDFKDDTTISRRALSGVTPAGITLVLPQILMNCSGAVDFTLRISAPQMEAGSFPTSYIPTAGSTVTRAADVMTIPAANLPWPEPVVIGPELVTNGTFDTDTSGWTDASSAGGSIAWNAAGYLDVINATGTARTYEDVVVESGKVYEISFDVPASTSGAAFFYLGSTSNTENIFSGVAIPAGSYSFKIAAISNLFSIAFRNFSAGTAVSLDNISVREIKPLAVSIQMEGRVTYADEGTFDTVVNANWQADANNLLRLRIDTNSTRTGRFTAVQTQSGIQDVSGSDDNAFSPDVLVPYNFASRHGSTFINGAVDGTALTADTTPVALPDLSATDLQLGFDYNGTIRTFRMWPNDLGDTGIEEASA